VEALADFGAGGGGCEEGGVIHGAVDGCEEIFAAFRAYAGGESLAGHGVGDADDGIAAAGGVALEGNPEAAGEGVLVGVEGQAMDGVDDQRTED